MNPLRIAPLPVLVAVLAGQVPQDAWAVGGRAAAAGQTGGLWLVAPDQVTWSRPNGQSAALQAPSAVTAGEGGMVYYASAPTSPSLPYEVFQVVILYGGVLAELRLSNGPLRPLVGGDIGVSGLCVRSSEVWYAAREGEVGFLHLGQGSGPPVRALDLRAQGVLSPPTAVATDGYEIFVGTQWNGTDAANVWAFEPAAPAATLRGVARTAIGAGPAGDVSGLAVGPDGDLVATARDGVVYRIDPFAGTAVPRNAPGAALDAGGVNPWLGRAAALPDTGGGGRRVDYLDLATGTWSPGAANLPAFTPVGIAPSTSPPFQLFGRGCPGVGGTRPRLGWVGLPQRGTTCQLRVRDVGPASLALCWVGRSRSASVFGPLPFDGAPYGAPGCTLLVSTDSVSAHVVAQGAAARPITLAANPALAGMVAYAQWAVLEPVNALGIATSDAVTILVR